MYGLRFNNYQRDLSVLRLLKLINFSCSFNFLDLLLFTSFLLRFGPPSCVPCALDAGAIEIANYNLGHYLYKIYKMEITITAEISHFIRNRYLQYKSLLTMQITVYNRNHVLQQRSWWSYWKNFIANQ